MRRWLVVLRVVGGKGVLAWARRVAADGAVDVGVRANYREDFDTDSASLARVSGEINSVGGVSWVSY